MSTILEAERLQTSYFLIVVENPKNTSLVVVVSVSASFVIPGLLAGTDYH